MIFGLLFGQLENLFQVCQRRRSVSGVIFSHSQCEQRVAGFEALTHVNKLTTKFVAIMIHENLRILGIFHECQGSREVACSMEITSPHG